MVEKPAFDDRREARVFDRSNESEVVRQLQEIARRYSPEVMSASAQIANPRPENALFDDTRDAIVDGMQMKFSEQEILTAALNGTLDLDDREQRDAAVAVIRKYNPDFLITGIDR